MMDEWKQNIRDAYPNMAQKYDDIVESLDSTIKGMYQCIETASQSRTIRIISHILY